MTELQTLIETFKSYRDLLTPIQANLSDFSSTYRALQEDISSLNEAFEGNMPEKLEKIYKDLSKEAAKAAELSQKIDRFSSQTSRFTQDFDKLSVVLTSLEEKLKAVTEVESKAEAQLEKLQTLLEEKRKNYDIKSLEKTVAAYNENVSTVSEYINKDIALTLEKNNAEIKSVKVGTEDISRRLEKENSSIEKLIGEYIQTNAFLKKIVENEDVNEAYLYDVLDRWADSRKIKRK